MTRVFDASAQAIVALSNGKIDSPTWRAVRGVNFKLDNGTKYSIRLNHGPLEPIFPGHCHEEIWICDPFGDKCIVLEGPWWCDPGEPPGNPDDDPIVIFG